MQAVHELKLLLLLTTSGIKAAGGCVSEDFSLALLDKTCGR
jgi:hypothetical protein